MIEWKSSQAATAADQSEKHSHKDRASLHIGILGAGLSAHVAIAFIKTHFPEYKITVIDQHSKEYFSSHSWCAFRSDFSEASFNILREFTLTSWENYRVKIGSLDRTLKGQYLYFSPKSMSPLRDRVNEWVTMDLDESEHTRSAPSEFKLSSRLESQFPQIDLFINCLGWKSLSQDSPCAYQKFLGLELEFEAPHQLMHPVLMDTNEKQIGGYRFTYKLPLSAHRLLLEDTFFSLSSELDQTESKRALLAQAQKFGRFSVVREEFGVLPLPYQQPDLSAVSSLNSERAGRKTVSLGARTSVCNALTGYTFAAVVRQCEALMFDLKQGLFDFTHYDHCNSELDQQNRFFELLNRMLYFSTPPERAYKIMERFYSLDREIIERLYASRITLSDRLKILALNPDVNRWSAFKCLLKNQPREFYGSELTR